MAAGQKLQHAVPAGAWFAAEPLGDFALVGELGKRNALVEEFPLAREAIVRLTPEYGCF